MRVHMEARPRGRAFFIAGVVLLCIGCLGFNQPALADDIPMTPEEAERLGEEFGMIVGSVDEEIRELLGLTRAEGVVVFEVIGGTPADLAGIKVKALIKEIDKDEVRDMVSFGRALKKVMGQCGFTIGSYEPATPENQGVGGVINFHLVRCLRD